MNWKNDFDCYVGCKNIWRIQKEWDRALHPLTQIYPNPIQRHFHRQLLYISVRLTIETEEIINFNTAKLKILVDYYTVDTIKWISEF